MTLTAALFDLDGTLTDPFEGITRSIQYALEKMGAPVPPQSDLRWCIGPSLWDSFAVLLETADRAEQDRAVAFYRERYRSQGLFENALINGIEGVLQGLQGRGVRLYVATSKPHAYAGTIVDHFGLGRYFVKVYGAELDGVRSDKAELLAYLLENEAVDPTRAVMVGDRKHDLVGARATGVPGIGVLWGYGDRLELEAESPIGLFDRPKDLEDFLLSMT
ncbi:HAD hydrolase-like protein [Roseibium aestuarii]|uniref:HAD hydrolase-like protein n=1 Tax=Roseibium aestuarii TaxID=2600299 RepID=A0ABW4K071_9HYPH|nr:HAD hydrolase-like protein [Roseibium aestuarii]